MLSVMKNMGMLAIKTSTSAKLKILHCVILHKVSLLKSALSKQWASCH